MAQEKVSLLMFFLINSVIKIIITNKFDIKISDLLKNENSEAYSNKNYPYRGKLQPNM